MRRGVHGGVVGSGLLAIVVTSLWGAPSHTLWCATAMVSRQDVDAPVDPALMVGLVASVVVQWYTMSLNPGLRFNALAGWTQGGAWMWSCWLWGTRGCSASSVHSRRTQAFVAVAAALDVIGAFACTYAGVALALTRGEQRTAWVLGAQSAALVEVAALRLPRSADWTSRVAWLVAASLLVVSVIPTLLKQLSLPRRGAGRCIDPIR